MSADAVEAAASRPSGGELAGAAIVTGASRNIGAAVAIELAAAGAAVAVNYRDEASLAAADEVVSQIRDVGGRALAIVADVADPVAVSDMVAQVEAELGPISILVNNAAASVAASRPWHEIEATEWADVLAVNVIGGANCAKSVLPSMLARGGGSIVNMSSVTALLGRTGNLHYVTSKAAQLGFTRSLARELGEHKIRVNSIVVGAIRTPDEALYGDPEELDRYLYDVQALKRRGLPVDVARATVYLASEASAFVTGQSITVDGGWVMH